MKSKVMTGTSISSIAENINELDAQGYTGMAAMKEMQNLTAIQRIRFQI